MSALKAMSPSGSACAKDDMRILKEFGKTVSESALGFQDSNAFSTRLPGGTATNACSPLCKWTVFREKRLAWMEVARQLKTRSSQFQARRFGCGSR